jgi:hypothetical protein
VKLLSTSKILFINCPYLRLSGFICVPDASFSNYRIKTFPKWKENFAQSRKARKESQKIRQNLIPGFYGFLSVLSSFA